VDDLRDGSAVRGRIDTGAAALVQRHPGARGRQLAELLRVLQPVEGDVDHTHLGARTGPAVLLPQVGA